MATGTMGPNFRRLVARKMSLDAVPSGGGIASAVKFITTPGVAKSAREAKQFVADAIALVRTAAEPNPFKTASDEDIAAEILRRIDERKTKEPTR